MGIQQNINQMLGTAAIATKLGSDAVIQDKKIKKDISDAIGAEIKAKENFAVQKVRLGNALDNGEEVSDEDVKKFVDVRHALWDAEANARDIKDIYPRQAKSLEKKWNKEMRKVDNQEAPAQEAPAQEAPAQEAPAQEAPASTQGAEDLRQQILHSTNPATQLLEKGIGNAGANQTHGLYAPHTHTPDQANSKAANEIKSKGESSRFMNEVVRNKENPEPKNQLYSNEVNKLMLANGPKGGGR